MRPKLGAKPSPSDARTLRLRDYLDTEKLKAPETWGYDNIVKPDGWGMLGNDQWGDCVFASAAHQVMLESRAAARDSSMTWWAADANTQSPHWSLPSIPQPSGLTMLS